VTFQDPTFENSQASPTASPPQGRPAASPPGVPDPPTVPPARRAYRPSGARDDADDRIQRQIDQEEAVRRGNRHLAMGTLWLVGGAFVTLATLLRDSHVYIVAWGPMVYGLYRIVVGGLTIRRNRD
jgi:hypothetical protein